MRYPYRSKLGVASVNSSEVVNTLVEKLGNAQESGCEGVPLIRLIYFCLPPSICSELTCFHPKVHVFDLAGTRSTET